MNNADIINKIEKEKKDLLQSMNKLNYVIDKQIDIDRKKLLTEIMNIYSALLDQLNNELSILYKINTNPIKAKINIKKDKIYI